MDSEIGSVWKVAYYPLKGLLLTSKNLTIKFPLMKRESDSISIDDLSLVHMN